MDAPLFVENELGAYLKACRAKLDPASLGLPLSRRRTPGLRREEVAQRANVSATWYTWLEQGRGGAPSATVLDRIAGALLLSDVEREHLFLLGLGRQPEAQYHPSAGVTPRLQRALDALPYSPAIVTTATWDVIAWNRAALTVLTDYEKLSARQRNILRLVFLDPRVRKAQADWGTVARFVVAAFRTSVARAGATHQIESLVNELMQQSPEFAALWRGHDLSAHAEGAKHMRHPKAGTISLECSAFAVDGRPDLSMMIYNPTTPEDGERVRSLLEPRTTLAVAGSPTRKRTQQASSVGDAFRRNG